MTLTAKDFKKKASVTLELEQVIDHLLGVKYKSLKTGDEKICIYLNKDLIVKSLGIYDKYFESVPQDQLNQECIDLVQEIFEVKLGFKMANAAGPFLSTRILDNAEEQFMFTLTW